MNEQLMYEVELRERASTATSLAAIFDAALEDLREGEDPEPLTRSQHKELDRMLEILADSARGSGLEPQLLAGIPAEVTARPDDERRDLYGAVSRLIGDGTDTRKVITWIRSASTAMALIRDSGWDALSERQQSFLRRHLVPFLKRLATSDQDIADDPQATISFGN